MCKVNNTYYQCSKVKYETKQRIIMDTNTKLVPTTVCCEGYEEIDQKCAPICKKPCENGYCSTPNQCKCNENYTLTEISRYFCNFETNKIQYNKKKKNIRMFSM